MWQTYSRTPHTNLLSLKSKNSTEMKPISVSLKMLYNSLQSVYVKLDLHMLKREIDSPYFNTLLKPQTDNFLMELSNAHYDQKTLSHQKVAPALLCQWLPPEGLSYPHTTEPAWPGWCGFAAQLGPRLLRELFNVCRKTRKVKLQIETGLLKWQLLVAQEFKRKNINVES